ncbi:hypothetical protein FRC04_008731 [Tulasnella sp. 424]|nr:hypothetical protein FRC04_008731 [Tulasnella sp. 424]
MPAVETGLSVCPSTFDVVYGLTPVSAARLFYYFLRPRISKLYGTDLVRLDWSVRVGPHWWKQYPDPFESSANCYSGTTHWNAWTVLRTAGGELVFTLGLNKGADGVKQRGDRPSRSVVIHDDKASTDWDQKNAYSTLAFVDALAALEIPFQGSNAGSSTQPQHTDNAGAIARSFSQAFAMFTCMFALANVIVSYKMRRMFKGRIMSRNDNTLYLRYMAASEQSRLGSFKLAFFLSLLGCSFSGLSVGDSHSFSSIFFCIDRAIEFSVSVFRYRQPSVPTPPGSASLFYIQVLVAILLFVAVLGSICIDPNRLDEPSSLDRPHQELSNVQPHLARAESGSAWLFNNLYRQVYAKHTQCRTNRAFLGEYYRREEVQTGEHLLKECFFKHWHRHFLKDAVPDLNLVDILGTKEGIDGLGVIHSTLRHVYQTVTAHHMQPYAHM